jgi:hypothetical protein
MATPYDFTTLPRAAARLKVSTSDVELPGLIAAASRALANWLGYEAHLREEVEETVPSEGGRYLWLRAGAVRRLVRVTVGGAEVEASAYHLDSPRHGRIVRRVGCWPFTGTWTAGVAPTPLTSHDTGEIRVTLDAGWRTPGQVVLALEENPASTLTSELPAELEEAALVVLAALYRPAGRDPNVLSRSTGGGSVTWRADASAVPLLAQHLAAPHRKLSRRQP